MSQAISNQDAFEENLEEILIQADQNDIDVRGVYDLSTNGELYTVEISQVVSE
jgi:hypothetical protein